MTTSESDYTPLIDSLRSLDDADLYERWLSGGPGYDECAVVLAERNTRIAAARAAEQDAYTRWEEHPPSDRSDFGRTADPERDVYDAESDRLGRAAAAASWTLKETIAIAHGSLSDLDKWRD